MRKIIFSILLFGCLGMILACEGIVGGDGYVLDAKTGAPLEDVKVQFLLNNNLQDSCYSEKNGFFRGSRFVGCVPKCPNAKIVLSKEGFKILTIDFDEYWENNTNSSTSRDSLILHLIPEK